MGVKQSGKATFSSENAASPEGHGTTERSGIHPRQADASDAMMQMQFLLM
jgi:hypothetical protein